MIEMRFETDIRPTSSTSLYSAKISRSRRQAGVCDCLHLISKGEDGFLQSCKLMWSVTDRERVRLR